MYAVTLDTQTHTHKQFNKRKKHKDMFYLCDFDALKII